MNEEQLATGKRIQAELHIVRDMITKLEHAACLSNIYTNIGECITLGARGDRGKEIGKKIIDFTLVELKADVKQLEQEFEEL